MGPWRCQDRDSACCHGHCRMKSHFPGTPTSLLPPEQGWDVPAVLATSSPRGSFLSLIDCTLLRACLQELLPFPRSFFLLLPPWPG